MKSNSFLKYTFFFLIHLSLYSLASQAGELVKLKLALNWKAEPQFGGFYAAQLNKEFIKAGLEVDIIEGGSGTPTVQLLSNNRVDFAIVSAHEIVISQDKNKENPVMGVFASYQTSPQCIMTHASRNFKAIEDIFKSDGILAIQPGITYFDFFKKKLNKIVPRIVPYPGGISSFLRDPKYSQQCFATSEPLTAEKAGVKPKVFLIADAGFNPYAAVMATQASRLSGANASVQKEIVRKMVAAVRRGWEIYLNNPDPTNEFMAKLNKGMDIETFKKSALAQIPLIKSPATEKFGLGYMESSRWATLLQQLIEAQIVHSDLASEKLFRNFSDLPN